MRDLRQSKTLFRVVQHITKIERAREGILFKKRRRQGCRRRAPGMAVSVRFFERNTGLGF